MDRRKTVITNRGPDLKETQSFRARTQEENDVQGLNWGSWCPHLAGELLSLPRVGIGCSRPFYQVLPRPGPLCCHPISAPVLQ